MALLLGGITRAIRATCRWRNVAHGAARLISAKNAFEEGFDCVAM
jgi:hypothetical protein